MGFCDHNSVGADTEYCPACGKRKVRTSRDVRRALRWKAYVLVAGLPGLLAACRFYRPLYANWVYFSGLGLFFAPVVLQVFSASRKRDVQHVRFLARAFLYCAILLLVLDATIAANGSLDRSNMTERRSTVVRKYISTGRWSTGYHVVVRSWRAGRITETLDVTRDIYRQTSIGGQVSADLHYGFLGLERYEGVKPL